jgi:hypothetical protein
MSELTSDQHLETEEFEKWWKSRQLEIWRSTLTITEQRANIPMPEHWGAGFKRASREAWNARAALGKTASLTNEETK